MNYLNIYIRGSCGKQNELICGRAAARHPIVSLREFTTLRYAFTLGRFRARLSLLRLRLPIDATTNCGGFIGRRDGNFGETRAESADSQQRAGTARRSAER